jgi:hypothetical protein
MKEAGYATSLVRESGVGRFWLWFSATLLAEEAQFACGIKLKQSRQKEAPEQFGQDTDRQQKAGP